MEGELKSRYEKYLALTEKALGKAVEAPENLDINDSTRKDFLDMAQRYISDAKHFFGKGDVMNAFAAVTYAHGWLDAGARIGLWDVHDNVLFTVDGEADNASSKK